MPPFNGSGTFIPYTPGNPAVTGTVISSTAFNATQQDIAAGLSNAVTRDGQSPPFSNLPMAGQKLTGLGPGLVAGDSVRFEQLATIPELTSLQSINGGPLAGLKNLLINGNFAINQRVYVSGAAVGAANTYTLDRWRVVTSGQSLTFSASGNGNSVTAPAGGLEQVIEGLSIAGGSYVLNWTGTATATVGGTARTKGEVFTLTAGANVTVRFTGGTVSFAQLEPGTVATPFEPRPYGLELSLCKRYLPIAKTGDVAQGVASSTSGGIVLFRFEVEPRVPPTGIISSGSASLTSGTASSTVTALTFSSAGSTSARLSVTGTGTPYTANSPLILLEASSLNIQFTGCEL